MPNPIASNKIACTLVTRVNQLFHDLTQASFDSEHRYRHRVERLFWNKVANVIPNPSRRPHQSLVVVDLACGTGFATQLLGYRLGSQDQLIAIDVTESALKTTARRWASIRRSDGMVPQLERLAGDGQALALADRCVDLVAMNAALHHVPDPKATLREIDRILKPGGWFALGFEPNRTHFASPPMAALSRGLDRAAWYASPRQNMRRVRRFLGKDTSKNQYTDAPDHDVLAACINEQLLQEGIITEPLTSNTLLDLVDPHARGAEDAAGFDPVQLLRDVMPDYIVHRLFSSDYLGETGRRSVIVRCIADAAFRCFLPQHGSLFCWMIRKPGPSLFEECRCRLR